MIEPTTPPASIKGNLRHLAVVQNTRIRDLNRRIAVLGLAPRGRGTLHSSPIPPGIDANAWQHWSSKLTALSGGEAATAGTKGNPVVGLTPPVPPVESKQLRAVLNSINRRIAVLAGAVAALERLQATPSSS